MRRRMLALFLVALPQAAALAQPVVPLTGSGSVRPGVIGGTGGVPSGPAPSSAPPSYAPTPTAPIRPQFTLPPLPAPSASALPAPYLPPSAPERAAVAPPP